MGFGFSRHFRFPSLTFLAYFFMVAVLKFVFGIYYGQTLLLSLILESSRTVDFHYEIVRFLA